MSARRGSNGFSAAPISWSDIDAFLHHSKLSLAPWQIRLLEDLDDIYRAAQAPKDQD